MSQVTANLMLVKQRLELAALAAKREPEDIQLLAVSKTFPAIAVEEAMHAGQTAFGENYVQEGVEKILQLAKLRPWLEWHFIGPLQSNKTRPAAENFDWVQSVDREKIAQRLSEQRPDSLKPLNVCVQINISGESSKSGVSPEDAFMLCEIVARLPKLNLRGLMAIPEPGANNMSLSSMRQLFDNIKLSLSEKALAPNFDTLSLGMSDDLEEAIAAGSTMVRIGTAIFGNRQYK